MSISKDPEGARLLRAGELTGRQRYRLLTSLLVPRPIAWVSTRSADGVRNLAPFSYFMGVSAAPMLIAVSVGLRRGDLKDTLVNVRERGDFAVNVVTERHIEAMVHTSGDWPPGTDEFQEAGVEAAECDVVDAPRVADAPAVLECRLFREVELGDAANALLVGEVLAVRLDPGLELDPESLHVESESLRPVARLGLDEYAFLGARHHLPRPRVG
jgi:flavin reductase (DIM6/NTAB) family NADH-FMN oxidoreductase RutF